VRTPAFFVETMWTDHCEPVIGRAARPP
jgi:hypothetical protein